MGGITYDDLEGKDAEKLDELFERKGSMVAVNPGKVIMPPEFKLIGEKILNMEVRPEDTWLVSFPRTGSTWTQEMVWLLGNNLNYEGAKTVQLLRTPLLELTAFMMAQHPELSEHMGNSVDIVAAQPSPRFIKTHLTWQLLPSQIHTVRPKIIYVARNPKDMCVSYYFHCKSIYRMKGSFEEFCELFLKEKTPIGSVWHHILGFWERRNDPNILFLKYEDMKRDHQGAIKKTAAFLGRDITNEQVQQLAEYLSFKNMKTNPAVNFDSIFQKGQKEDVSDLSFIRKGQVGDHKNYMTPELITRFDDWMKLNLAGTDLTFE